MESFDAILKAGHDHLLGKEPASSPAEPVAPATGVESSPQETVAAEIPAGTQAAAPTEDDDGEQPSPDVYGKVPLKALESERAKRQDWKAQAIQAQERQKAAEARIEELTKASSAPPAQQAAPLQAPNPVEDPEAFTRYVEFMAQEKHLHMSEQMLRSQHQDVDAKLQVFMAAAKDNPTLIDKANKQAHPWGWMYEQASKMAKLSEIGDDPAAYEAKVRAKLEAELRDVAPSASATHRPGVSLAAVRSSASGKSMAAQWTGPAPLESLVGAQAVANRR